MQDWKLIRDSAPLGDDPSIQGDTSIRPLQNYEGSEDARIIADAGFTSTAYPKLKFNFTATIDFRDEVFGSEYMETLRLPLKTASRPKQNITLVDVNYYNYRTKVAVKTEVGSGSIVMYDDADGTVHGIYQKYMNMLSPITNVGHDWSLINNPTKHPFGSLSSLGPMPTNPNGIFKAISVYHFYNVGKKVKRMEYRYINPRVESFELDDLSMSESDVTTLTLNFAYDSVTCIETVIGNVNGYSGDE